MLYLNLDIVYAYANATPTSRNMIEGQNVINSGMIIMCGATVKTHEILNLFALCLQTSALTSEPHVISGTLSFKLSNNNNENEEIIINIERMDCSCKAGTSHSCKHVVAVLLFCNRHDLKSLPMVSSTDKKCLWNQHKKPVLEQFQALPTKTFCCVKQSRLERLSVSKLFSIRTRLINCDKESSVAKHQNRQLRRSPLSEIQNCVSTCQGLSCATENDLDYTQQIINNASKSVAISILKETQVVLNDCCHNVYNTKVMCSDIAQLARSTKASRYEWEKERKYRITGSRCYSIYTYSRNDWVEKAKKYFWAKEVKNKYTAHGNKYEGVARNLYKKEQDLFVEECGLIVCKNEPWLAYSSDGVVIKEAEPIKLLEIKCPYELNDTSNETLLKQCKFLHWEGNALNLKKKHQYYGQVQLGMALLNLKNCDFVIYSSVSNTIAIINVNFDAVFVNHNQTKVF